MVLNLATRREPSCRRSWREVDGMPGSGPGQAPTVCVPASASVAGAVAALLLGGPAPSEDADGADADMGSGPGVAATSAASGIAWSSSAAVDCGRVMHMVWVPVCVKYCAPTS